MKNIITALNHPELNNILKKENNIKIINKDIIYKEGILEILEIKKEIDFIIINYDLPGKISIDNLIQEIKKINEKIELIFILEKENIEKEKILKKYEIQNIYYNNQIDIKNLVEIINEKNNKSKEELEEEIIKLKKIIQNNKKQNPPKIKKREKKCSTKNTQNSLHKTRKIPNSLLIEQREQTPSNSLAVELIGNLKNKKKRILIVDLKLDHENIHNAFHKANIYRQIENKNFLININKNIKLMTGLSKKIKNNSEKEINKIVFEIEKFSKKYDKVIIEILENNYQKLNEKIMEKTEKNIFIFENNIQEIKIMKQKIEKNKKIKNKYLYLNQKNKIEEEEKISLEILKEIFKKTKIIKDEKELIKLIK